jgi:peptidyl-prolyl cis-trans isomerase C
MNHKLTLSKLSLAAVVAVAGALALPAAVSAQNIAIVNGKSVPKARFDAFMTQIAKQAQAQGQPQQRTPELERQVRDELVMREIFMQEAERRGLQSGAEYRTQMEFARQGFLVRELFADFQKKNPVTDEEVKAEYDKVKAQAGTEKEYRARHILVEKEDEAKALLLALKGGAKFEDLAKKSSKDPGSAQNGGDLDWAQPGNYVAEFSQALTKLEKGKYTEAPVKSQFGYHIIQLEDVRETKFPALEEVKGQIEQKMAQQKMAKFRDDLKTKAKTDYKFAN